MVKNKQTLFSPKQLQYVPWPSFFLFLYPFCVIAQNGVSVTYEIRSIKDSTLYSKQLLVVNNSVSFEAVTYNRGVDYKVKRPLGNGFENHNTYTDLSRNLVIWQSQPFNNPKYLVRDTIQKLDWAVVEGEKEILGYTCKKAVTSFRNHLITAWFAPSLPFSFGPGYYGLPGLILELVHSGSHTVCIAAKLSATTEQILEPNKGKRITAAEFQKVLSELKP